MGEISDPGWHVCELKIYIYNEGKYGNCIAYLLSS